MSTTEHSTPDTTSKGIREKDLMGKAIVSMGDGAKVGTVKELVFQHLTLSSLVVRGEHGEGLLRYQDIGANGPDAGGWRILGAP